MAKQAETSDIPQGRNNSSYSWRWPATVLGGLGIIGAAAVGSVYLSNQTSPQVVEVVRKKPDASDISIYPKKKERELREALTAAVADGTTDIRAGLSDLSNRTANLTKRVTGLESTVSSNRTAIEGLSQRFATERKRESSEPGRNGMEILLRGIGNYLSNCAQEMVKTPEGETSTAESDTTTGIKMSNKLPPGVDINVERYQNVFDAIMQRDPTLEGVLPSYAVLTRDESVRLNQDGDITRRRLGDQISLLISYDLNNDGELESSYIVPISDGKVSSSFNVADLEELGVSIDEGGLIRRMLAFYEGSNNTKRVRKDFQAVELVDDFVRNTEDAFSDDVITAYELTSSTLSDEDTSNDWDFNKLFSHAVHEERDDLDRGHQALGRLAFMEQYLLARTDYLQENGRQLAEGLGETSQDDSSALLTWSIIGLNLPFHGLSMRYSDAGSNREASGAFQHYERRIFKGDRGNYSDDLEFSGYKTLDENQRAAYAFNTWNNFFTDVRTGDLVLDTIPKRVRVSESDGGSE
ncbi:MAG: hypothetical protein ACOCXG_00235 [Nanoarchaeota archaeon]